MLRISGFGLLLLASIFSNVSLAMGIPAPQTLAAEAITATSATLKGVAMVQNDTLGSTHYEAGFKLVNIASLTTTDLPATPFSIPYPINADVPFSAQATNLTCNTRYQFWSYIRAVEEAAEVNGGPPQFFTTLPCVPPPAPQPIPTLSEWAQIMMMLAMIATAGFYGWRMKQR